MLVDSSVAQFGIFTVDTYDKARMIENMGIRSLPTTRFVQFKATRPTGPKGPLSGRPVMLLVDLPSGTSAEDIVQNALQHTAMRYHHPITNQPIPAVTYVLTLDDLVERAKFSLPSSTGDAQQNSLASLSGGEFRAPAVIYYFHLMKKNHLNVHAEINSLGARMGPRLTVFATEDADIAKRFGLNETFSAASFFLKNVNVDAKVRKFPDTVAVTSTVDELATAGACSAFGEEHAIPNADYQKALDTELKSWHRDLTAYYGKSPFRKITHSSQFLRDVMSNKATVSVIFMLREADKMFNRYHRTGIEFASYIRDPYRVAPGIYAKVHQNLNFETYWIDGEVQDVASAFLGTKSVPSIAFLMHTQGGNVAVKYFSFSEEDKKRRKKQGKDLEWPDVQDLLAYISSETLLQSAPGMVPFTEKDVKFNDNVPATTNDANHKYLNIDRKHYNMAEEKDNTFLQDLANGKITVDADHYAKDEDKADSKKAAKSKKAAAKEAERKLKIQEELERKQKEREERTKAKEEADKKRREEEAARTKAEITAKAKEEKKNSKEGKRAPIEGQSITAPPLEKGRFKKDFNVWTKGWEADKRKMVDKFVKNIKGGLRVGKGLSVPDWKKK
eukprot:GILJ01017011.1.p1 GENE.GILJ01017011.1~~GILJ01017011.1.p1  ORF type:complete len:616 (+),score=163.26 GILJ01017011.1:76-1923(+)